MERKYLWVPSYEKPTNLIEHLNEAQKDFVNLVEIVLKRYMLIIPDGLDIKYWSRNIIAGSTMNLYFFKDKLMFYTKFEIINTTTIQWSVKIIDKRGYKDVD